MENQSTLFSALAKAQSEFLVAVKNREANYGLYADLSSCLDAVRPALNKYGIFLNQRVNSTALDVTVETFLSHESGEVISSGPLTIPISGKGMNAAQQMGSALTYARRYSLCSFLGIVGDADDDAQSLGTEKHQPQEPVSNPAADAVVAKAVEAANKGTKAFAEFWKSASIEERGFVQQRYPDRLKSVCLTADKQAQQAEPLPEGVSQNDDGTYSW